MDNGNKVLIGVVVAVLAFLAFPIVMKQMKGQNAATTAAGTTQGAASGQSEAKKYPELNDPPLLNEGNLVGTEWQVIAENYKIKISLGPAGVCYASHPMAKALTGMDYVEGHWEVHGDKLHANATIAGQSAEVDLKISGMKLFFIDPKTGRPDEVKKF